MRQGAVAVLDAMGFKGIYNRTDPNKVLKKLEALQKGLVVIEDRLTKKMLVRDYVDDYDGPGFFEWKLWTLSFSDSIILGCFGEICGPVLAEDFSLPKAVQSASIIPLAHAISMILVGGVATSPELLYRGVIAFGDYVVKDKIIIGPAIDEAASLESQADAAIVWFSPSAKEAYDKLGFPQSHFIIKDYPVPFKDGQTFTTYVVNPLTYQEVTKYEPESLVKCFLEFFRPEDDAGILKKKQHTERLLTASLAQVDSKVNEVGGFIQMKFHATLIQARRLAKKGRDLASESDFAGAIAKFSEAIKIIEIPPDSANDADRMVLLTELLRERSLLYGSAEDYPAALSDAQKAVRLMHTVLEYDTNKQRKVDLVHTMLVCAKAKYLSNQVRDASEDFLMTALVIESTAREIDSELFPSLITMIDECVSACRQIASESKDKRYVSIFQAVLLRSGITKTVTGSIMEAIGDFEWIVEMGLQNLKTKNTLSTDFFEAWRRRGDALASLGKLKESVNDFKRLEKTLKFLLESGGAAEMASDFQIERALVLVSWSKVCTKMDETQKAAAYRRQAKHIYESLDVRKCDSSNLTQLNTELERLSTET